MNEIDFLRIKLSCLMEELKLLQSEFEQLWRGKTSVQTDVVSPITSRRISLRKDIENINNEIIKLQYEN